MKKIKAIIPIYADAEFALDKPNNWDTMNDTQKFDFFVNKMK